MTRKTYLLRSALFIAAAGLSTFLAAQIILQNRELPSPTTEAANLEAGVVRPAGHSESFGNVPMSFEANRGQTDDSVRFLARGRGYTLLLSPTNAVISLRKSSRRTLEPVAISNPAGCRAKSSDAGVAVVRMNFVGADPDAEIDGLDPLPGKSNYFIGSNPDGWHTDIPTFGKVRCRDIYPGVDLIYYGNQSRLEYDFVVSPGADPGNIAFTVEGAEKLEVSPDGDLVARADGGEVQFRHPVIYQKIGEERHRISGEYVLEGDRQVGFRLEDYDVSEPLVIDPILIYSTYLGGTSNDEGHGIAVDAAGSAYVVGVTRSVDFPTQSSFQAVSGGLLDAYITKLNSTGNAIVFSTYIGGGLNDSGEEVVVDALNNVYVSGTTGSTNFPTASPFQAANAGGGSDAFVLKLNSAGNALVYSTYLGGGGTDTNSGIAIDSTGNAYLTGSTGSTNFPTANPFRSVNFGSMDVYATKLNAAGSALVYSTYLGGAADDNGYGITVSGTGEAYLTGESYSSNFPTVTTFQAVKSAESDAFVARLNGTGNVLLYSTFLGGSGTDAGTSISLDVGGQAFVVGRTNSSNFPVANAIQAGHGGGWDAFVSRFTIDGNFLIYSTYLGGSGDEFGSAIIADPNGNAYVAGSTFSPNFPTKDPLQVAAGGYDAFNLEISATGSALVYSTYLGGEDADLCLALAIDSIGNSYLTGYTFSTGFPTANPMQAAYGGLQDAFVTRYGGGELRLAITMSQSVYHDGDTITATNFKLQNLRPTAEAVELGVWLEIPTLSPIPILNLGYDGSLVLPAQLDAELGPLPLLAVTSGFPRGSYAFSSRMENPVTKADISEDLNLFQVQ